MFYATPHKIFVFFLLTSTLYFDCFSLKPNSSLFQPKDETTAHNEPTSCYKLLLECLDIEECRNAIILLERKCQVNNFFLLFDKKFLFIAKQFMSNVFFLWISLCLAPNVLTIKPFIFLKNVKEEKVFVYTYWNIAEVTIIFVRLKKDKKIIKIILLLSIGDIFNHILIIAEIFLDICNENFTFYSNFLLTYFIIFFLKQYFCQKSFLFKFCYNSINPKLIHSVTFFLSKRLNKRNITIKIKLLCSKSLISV